MGSDWLTKLMKRHLNFSFSLTIRAASLSHTWGAPNAIEIIESRNVFCNPAKKNQDDGLEIRVHLILSVDCKFKPVSI